MLPHKPELSPPKSPQSVPSYCVTVLATRLSDSTHQFSAPCTTSDKRFDFHHA